MPEIAFVMSAGQDWRQREFAETLAYELGRQEVPSTVEFGFPAPREGLIQLLVDPDSFVAVEGEDALPDAATLARTVFLSTGRPAPPSEERVALLRQAGAVFDIHPRAVLHLRRAGIPARLLKPGYSEHLDHFDPAAARTVDVMFLGGHSRRRADLLARLAPTLARWNCLLSLAPPDHDPTRPSGYFGAAKWDLLAASKVVLNLHHGEEASFEWRRAMDAIHAGAVVVSEPSVGLAPLVAGEHLLVAEADALPFVLESILGDPERLAAIQSAAYERASQWMPLAMGIGVLRAAAVELVGEPLVGSAQSTQVEGDTEDEAEPLEAAIEATRQELEVARGELAAVRGELDRVERRLASRLARQDRATRWVDSSAWEAPRPPRVSVLMALTGSAAATRAALRGLEHQRDRTFELVAIDAGAGAGTLDAVSAWIRARPRVPARLLALGTGGDVDAARDLALGHARARHCLILDPGTDLYPRALEVLSGTLDGLPDVAFVYPMVALPVAEDGRRGLCNCFGWSRQTNSGTEPVPPALVRRSVLRDIGGLTSELTDAVEPVWWRRLADHGLRGQLVPQVLAARTGGQLIPA